MKLITNKETPWLCYKDPNSNLIWWVHSKCACSFYKTIFERLQWIKTTSDKIDWDNNVVFGHIRDPLTKHRIGIVEWFYFTKNQQLLTENFNNAAFFRMLSEIAYLDFHSMSILEHLGPDNSARMHWIPIDTGNNHVTETLEFVASYTELDPEFLHWAANLQPIHVSTDFKKQCNQKLLEIEPTPLIIKSLEYDTWLYDSVSKKNFEPKNYSNRITELKKQGLSQHQAEEQADQEVASGQYMQWNK